MLDAFELAPRVTLLVTDDPTNMRAARAEVVKMPGCGHILTMR